MGVCNLSAVEEWGNCIRLHISGVISPGGPTISSRFHDVSVHVDLISVTSGLSRRRIVLFCFFCPEHYVTTGKKPLRNSF